jgi:hypothetical protein
VVKTNICSHYIEYFVKDNNPMKRCKVCKTEWQFEIVTQLEGKWKRLN